jgi:hypothetical protein
VIGQAAPIPTPSSQLDQRTAYGRRAAGRRSKERWPRQGYIRETRKDAVQRNSISSPLVRRRKVRTNVSTKLKNPERAVVSGVIRMSSMKNFDGFEFIGFGNGLAAMLFHKLGQF